MLTDPIADMLTRVRNAQSRNKIEVAIPYSHSKEDITKVLLDEGYIHSYRVDRNEGEFPQLVIVLKYHRGEGVIKKIARVSTPGRRVYRGVKQFEKVIGGLGILIISTPQGVMTDRQARKLGIGGEVWCSVF